MLNYMEFLKEFTEQLKKELAADGIEVSSQSFSKVNGVMEGIVIKYPETAVAPVIYPQEEDFQEHRVMDKEVSVLAKERADYIRNLKNHMPDMPELNWDPERLYACVVNSDDNAELLRDAPHIDVEDLSIMVRYRVSPDASMVVNNQVCSEQFRMTSEELLQVARDNTYHQGYQLQSLDGMISGLMRDAGASDDYLYDMQAAGPDKSIMVLTNPGMVDGAVLGTDPRVLQEVHDIIGEDYYILPSSRHELLLVPESLGLDKDFLQEMVRDVNQAVVNERDYLSDTIYECRGPQMVLTLAGKDMEPDQEPVLEKTMGHSR